MDGIYFEQGMEAAKKAASLADGKTLCPHGTREHELPRRRCWMNGFVYGFDKPEAVASRLLRAQTLSGSIAIEVQA